MASEFMWSSGKVTGLLNPWAAQVTCTQRWVGGEEMGRWGKANRRNTREFGTCTIFIRTFRGIV